MRTPTDDEMKDAVSEEEWEIDSNAVDSDGRILDELAIDPHAIEEATGFEPPTNIIGLDDGALILKCAEATEDISRIAARLGWDRQILPACWAHHPPLATLMLGLWDSYKMSFLPIQQGEASLTWLKNAAWVREEARLLLTGKPCATGDHTPWRPTIWEETL